MDKLQNNPYRSETPKDIANKKAETKKINDMIRGAAEQGRLCLDDDKFKKYRVQCAAVREELISMLKRNVEVDPAKFGGFAKTCICKIDVLDMLLDLIDNDAKIAVKKETDHAAKKDSV
jgi:hypothetical protein